jgi:predicted ferric reductase
MELLDIFISASITIFSLALLMISLLSYWKYRNIKLVFISLIVLVFFIRGLFLSLGLFNDQVLALTSRSSFWLFDLLILVLLYITALKR